MQTRLPATCWWASRTGTRQRWAHLLCQGRVEPRLGRTFWPAVLSRAKPYIFIGYRILEMVGKPHSSSNLPSKYRKCWEIVKFCDTYYAATTRIPTMWFTSNPHSSSRIVTYLVSIAVPSTRCAHHACTNLRESSFNSNIHALRVFSRMYLMDTSRCRMVWAFNCTGTGTEIFC